MPERPGQPEPWLQIRVRNATHRVTLNMAERSKGFIWFLSFLAAFSEYAEEDRRVILLDEPGLNLHAKAQGDLLRYIDERLATDHQVIYSTHSLFMIQPRHLQRCRTVEDLFDQGWYLKLLKESKVGVVAKNKLTGGRIVKQAEAALGARFDHYQPASHFMRTATKLRDEVDDATIDRFAQLFARINNLLST